MITLRANLAGQNFSDFLSVFADRPVMKILNMIGCASWVEMCFHNGSYFYEFICLI